MYVYWPASLWYPIFISWNSRLTILMIAQHLRHEQEYTWRCVLHNHASSTVFIETPPMGTNTCTLYLSMQICTSYIVACSSTLHIYSRHAHTSVLLSVKTVPGKRRWSIVTHGDDNRPEQCASEFRVSTTNWCVVSIMQACRSCTVILPQTANSLESLEVYS